MAVSDYTALINASAAKYGVDPNLVAAVMAAESGGDPSATSPTGAQGLMQLEPATAAALGVSNAYDPAQNIDGGAHYLAEQLATFNGNATLAIAAYNAGPGAVQAAGGIPNNGETPAYVQTVTAAWDKLTGNTGPVTGAVNQFVVGDSMPGSTASTVFGQNLGTPATAAMGAQPVNTTPTTPAAAPGFNAADPLGIGAAFDRAIAAAKNIALEVFVGAAALALLSGGIMWLASTDPNVRSAVKTAGKVAAA